jgi:putative FmdB family regulatory protein
MAMPGWARRAAASICAELERENTQHIGSYNFCLMPIYEYACPDCGHQFEKQQKFSDSPVQKCPNCGKRKVYRMVSKVAVTFKGSGWYITDSKKSDSVTHTATREKKGEEKAETKTETSSETKSETKRETKAEAKTESKPESKGEAKPDKKDKK